MLISRHTHTSHVDVLLLVVYFEVELVVVSDEGAGLEWESWLLKVGVLSLELLIEAAPLAIVVLAFLLILFNSVLFALFRRHLNSLIECVGVDFLKDRL